MSEAIHTTTPMALTVYERDVLAVRRKIALAAVLAAAAALIVAVVVVLYVAWKIVSSVQATAFDADGVRCYTKADRTSCIKTAEPPR